MRARSSRHEHRVPAAPNAATVRPKASREHRCQTDIGSLTTEYGLPYRRPRAGWARSSAGTGAEVMQPVDILDSDSGSCGFESLPRHQHQQTHMNRPSVAGPAARAVPHCGSRRAYRATDSDEGNPTGGVAKRHTRCLYYALSSQLCYAAKARPSFS